MVRDGQRLPFDDVPESRQAFMQDWKALSKIPASKFLADRERQLTVYAAFEHHRRSATQVGNPPVIVFREDPADMNDRFLSRPAFAEFANLNLAPRSGLRRDAYIARFSLNDPEHLYLVTPPIDVYHASAKPDEIGVARVPIHGGYKQVWTEQGSWQEDQTSGLYVRQNTRNVSEIKGEVRPRTASLT